MPSLVEMQYDHEQNIMCLEKIAMKNIYRTNIELYNPAIHIYLLGTHDH